MTDPYRGLNAKERAKLERYRAEIGAEIRKAADTHGITLTQELHEQLIVGFSDQTRDIPQGKRAVNTFFDSQKALPCLNDPTLREERIAHAVEKAAMPVRKGLRTGPRGLVEHRSKAQRSIYGRE